MYGPAYNKIFHEKSPIYYMNLLASHTSHRLDTKDMTIICPKELQSNFNIICEFITRFGSRRNGITLPANGSVRGELLSIASGGVAKMIVIETGSINPLVLEDASNLSACAAVEN
jgi:hypothetical protein